MPRSPRHQYSLQLIDREVESSIVQQRLSDGYINATALCHAAGKRWHNYIRNESSGNFLRKLSQSEGIEQQHLVQETRTPDGQASIWVHPKVAIHLGQWLSAEFAVKVTDWVYDWISGKAGPTRKAALPPHLQRHMLNLHKVPPSHFSILQEMTTWLIGPLEAVGYTLPEKMVPDISQGKMFCQHARTKLGIDTDALPTYQHEYPDGRVFPAKLYPVAVLGEFRTFIAEVWLPGRAAEYFRSRDPAALPYLDKVLLLGSAAESQLKLKRR